MVQVLMLLGRSRGLCLAPIALPPTWQPDFPFGHARLGVADCVVCCLHVPVFFMGSETETERQRQRQRQIRSVAISAQAIL
eukprot:4139874-Lingulodinium_polyedra.AAC.1